MVRARKNPAQKRNVAAKSRPCGISCRRRLSERIPWLQILRFKLCAARIAKEDLGPTTVGALLAVATIAGSGCGVVTGVSANAETCSPPAGVAGFGPTACPRLVTTGTAGTFFLRRRRRRRHCNTRPREVPAIPRSSFMPCLRRRPNPLLGMYHNVAPSTPLRSRTMPQIPRPITQFWRMKIHVFRQVPPAGILYAPCSSCAMAIRTPCHATIEPFSKNGQVHNESNSHGTSR
jgi:hypothetical protein